MTASEQRVPDDKIRLLGRFRYMDEATKRKLIKFTWSGLLIVLLGCVLIAVGLSMNTGAYSTESLLIGFGVIAIIVGIIRILIGFINPLSPADLEQAAKPPADLDQELFES